VPTASGGAGPAWACKLECRRERLNAHVRPNVRALAMPIIIFVPSEGMFFKGFFAWSIFIVETLIFKPVFELFYEEIFWS
jgi:hypothetical protein